jgi:hypothetical protein
MGATRRCCSGVLQAVGVALAGRAGVRLLTVLHAVVSRVTLVALVMAIPDPVVSTVAILLSVTARCHNVILVRQG